MTDRYENRQRDFMLDVERKETYDGQIIIYVKKCKKYVRGKRFKY